MTAKFASLHAGLLARKGQAAPVFMNPAVAYIDDPRPIGEADDDDVQRRDVASADGLPLMAEKIGGDDVSNGQLTPMMMNGIRPARAGPRKPRLVTDEDHHDSPYRFSFRMPADQHRRLRVAAAQKNISLQQALSDALDNYLDGLCACSLKECNCMARQGEAQKN